MFDAASMQSCRSNVIIKSSLNETGKWNGRVMFWFSTKIYKKEEKDNDKCTQKVLNFQLGLTNLSFFHKFFQEYMKY